MADHLALLLCLWNSSFVFNRFYCTSPMLAGDSFLCPKLVFSWKYCPCGLCSWGSTVYRTLGVKCVVRTVLGPLSWVHQEGLSTSLWGLCHHLYSTSCPPLCCQLTHFWSFPCKSIILKLTYIKFLFKVHLLTVKKRIHLKNVFIEIQSCDKNHGVWDTQTYNQKSKLFNKRSRVYITWSVPTRL